MTLEEKTAAGGSFRGQRSMPRLDSRAQPAPNMAVACELATELAEQLAPSSKRQRRGAKEMAALSSGDGSAREGGGRPSRRAASAAQAAIAQTYAFEQQKGMAMSPPRVAEQSLAMRLMESTVQPSPFTQLQPSAPKDELSGAAAAADLTRVDEPAEGFTAAPSELGDAAVAGAAVVTAAGDHAAPADGQAPLSTCTAAAGGPIAVALLPTENGKPPVSGKKRKKPEGAADEAVSGGDGAAAEGTPAAPLSAAPSQPQQPQEPSQPVDLAPYVNMARQCESQEELREKLNERLPPTRGRSVHNVAFRDLFLTLCAGQVFHNRASAMPHVTYHLFRMAGKPVGKPPAPYKPRGPRSPSATAGGTPLGPLAADSAPPSGAAAAAPAAASRGPPLGPAAGLAAEQAAAVAALQPGGGVPAGPAAAAAARAAATASGEVVLVAGMDPAAAMKAVLADYPPELVRLAALVRRALSLQKGAVVHLRLMLKTGLLAGQEVRFQTKAGRIQNHGRLNGNGSITCFCKQCGSGGREVSASEFEEHSGSKDRRPADGIFLEASNRSLKDLLNLVNSPEMAACTGEVDVHMEVCQLCNQGGELLCCDGCTAAYHFACVNLDAAPPGDWFCPLCVAAGITTKTEPLPLQPKQLGTLNPLRSGSKMRPSSSGKLSKKPPGGASSASEAGGLSGQGSLPLQPRPAAGGTGRVRMAAPTAPRAPRLGRPGARSNKNKRLFEGEEGALVNGQKLFYRTTQGETLLEGVAVVERGGPSGILCGCCNTLISASGFEAHAGRGQRRAPYDNIFTEEGITLKAMAALLPDLDESAAGERRGGEYGLDELADDAREVISELDTLAGGCVLCHEVDFQRGGFGPRTIMLCDQCEREFHVGCLKKCGVADLDAVPEGDWYCSEECERIRSNIDELIQAQQMDIPGFPSHTWQVMRGKDGKSSTSWALRAAQEILQESFDPIMDIGNNIDLLPIMLYAKQVGEWDYSNCLTLLLRHKGKPVVAAICRVFGPQMAELPLIATKNTARRQGHARILVNCFEEILRKSGVHTLVLPAAHETVQTWKSGFGFADMPEAETSLAKQQLRILIFPGTEVLYKQYPEVPPPQGHHVLVRSLDRPSAEEAREIIEVATITANMVVCLCAAFGEPVLPEALGMTSQPTPASAPPAAQREHQQALPATPRTQQQPQPQLQQTCSQPAQPQGPRQAPDLAQQPQQQPAAAEPADDYEGMIAAAIAAGSKAAAGQAADSSLLRSAGLPSCSTAAGNSQQLPAAGQSSAAAPMEVDAAPAAARAPVQEAAEPAGPAPAGADGNPLNGEQEGQQQHVQADAPQAAGVDPQPTAELGNLEIQPLAADAGVPPPTSSNGGAGDDFQPV